MGRFNELRTAYVGWQAREALWDAIGRGLPLAFKQGLSAFLDAPSVEVRAFPAGVDGPYVDFYIRTETADSAEYKRVAPYHAATKNSFGEWVFMVGAMIDREHGSLPRLMLALPYRIGRDGDDLRISVEPSERKFLITFDSENPVDFSKTKGFEPIYAFFFETLMAFLRSPVPPHGKSTIGFSVGRA
jgi:hypothetical protein